MSTTDHWQRVSTRTMERDELAVAYKEGQWAWTHGRHMDPCPYHDDQQPHHAQRWRQGWSDLDALNRELDLTSDLAGNPS